MTEEKKGVRFKQRIMKQLSWIHLIGIVVGLAGGFIYYRTVGCASGACPIQSNPYLTMLWGGMMGYLLADLLPRKKKKASVEPNESE